MENLITARRRRRTLAALGDPSSRQKTQAWTIYLLAGCTGALLEATDSYAVPFVVSGTMIALGGVICLPARRIARWEASRHSATHRHRQTAWFFFPVATCTEPGSEWLLDLVLITATSFHTCVKHLLSRWLRSVEDGGFKCRAAVFRILLIQSILKITFRPTGLA